MRLLFPKRLELWKVHPLYLDRRLNGTITKNARNNFQSLQLPSSPKKNDDSLEAQQEELFDVSVHHDLSYHELAKTKDKKVKSSQSSKLEK